MKENNIISIKWYLKRRMGRIYNIGSMLLIQNKKHRLRSLLNIYNGSMFWFSDAADACVCQVAACQFWGSSPLGVSFLALSLFHRCI